MLQTVRRFQANMGQSLPILASALMAVLACGVAGPSFAQTASSCTIDLKSGTSDCAALTNITVQSLVDQQGLVAINLDPAVTAFNSVCFDVTYNRTTAPTGWTVNIGDSVSNNGYAGDGGDQTNDAETQILNTQLSVYGSDNSPSYLTNILSISGVLSKSRAITLCAANNSLNFEYGLNKSSKGMVNAEYLYALAGQSDQEGAVNYTLYAGFNRVISGGDRTGTGATAVTIRLLTK